MPESTMITISIVTAVTLVGSLVLIGVAWGSLRQRVIHIESLLTRVVDGFKLEAKIEMKETEARVVKDLRDTEGRLLKDINGVGRKLEEHLRDGHLARRAGSSSPVVDDD